MGRFHKLTAPLLALAILLSGCLRDPSGTPDSPDTPDAPDSPSVTPQTPETVSRADNVFSVNYDPDESLNPFTATNVYNQQLLGLVYEGLFELGGDLAPRPVLCRDYETQDGIRYTFALKEGVRFHNGAALTAADVVYSINEARNSAKYSSRLDGISYAGVGEDGQVEIHLKRADYGLPALLDIPVVPEGTAQEETPPGTGPYRMGVSSLTVFTGHRDYAGNIPGNIYLKEIAVDQLAESFSERDVDLLCYDPNGGAKLNIHVVHETRYYDTTDLLFLGFNCAAKVTSDTLVRRALVRLVDRDTIADEIYGAAARKSAFILSPALGYYDDSDATGYGYSRRDFQRLAMIAGLEDTDSDGNLEYLTDVFSLRFIVNSESETKLAAARRIATDMRNMGINVTLDELTFAQYQSALRSGNFSLYLGEVRLKADFDLSALFTGSLNYGKITDPEYRELINAYLSSPEGERQEAADALDLYAAEDAAILPILYKQSLVLTHLGVIQGIDPGLSNIYSGAAGWTVDLSAGRS